MVKFTDHDHLQGLFYNIYEIDSLGIEPQRALLTALTTGTVRYDPKISDQTKFSLQKALKYDTKSNLLSNPVIARILDPKEYEAFEKMNLPTDYFGARSENIRTMMRELKSQSAKGRSFALRCLAGLDASMDQPAVTEDEARSLAKTLTHRYGGKLIIPDDCVDFILDRKGAIRAIEKQTYEFWNTTGRKERTLLHAQKLDLFNEIASATIDKAVSLGLHPSSFTRNDPSHADYWNRTFNESVPTPDVLLERSRVAVTEARSRYSR